MNSNNKCLKCKKIIDKYLRSIFNINNNVVCVNCYCRLMNISTDEYLLRKIEEEEKNDLPLKKYHDTSLL